MPGETRLYTGTNTRDYRGQYIIHYAVYSQLNQTKNTDLQRRETQQLGAENLASGSVVLEKDMLHLNESRKGFFPRRGIVIPC